MTDTLATEVTTAAASEQPKPHHEEWHSNERMRHVPRVHWIADKLDGDLRTRIEGACKAIESAEAHDPRRQTGDAVIRTLCRGIEHLADVAKHTRGQLHPPNELSRHVSWSIQHAVASLRAADDDVIGRRYPFQTFERSKAEPLYGALLLVIDASHRLVDAARAIDPNIDGVLLEGLVRLSAPMRTEPMA